MSTRASVDKGGERTYRPVAANSNIEDNVEWRVCECRPDSLVPNLSTSDDLEREPVHGPGDGLGLPRTWRTVHCQRPVVKSVAAQHRDRGAQAGALVAGPALIVRAAVDSAVAQPISIDLLENIELTTQGPFGAMTNRISEHPEGRPDTLGIGGVSQTKTGLVGHLLVGLRGPRVLGFDAAGGPSTLLIFPRYQLKGVASGELDVLVGFSVILHFAVGVDVQGSVPDFVTGRATTAALEGLLPGNLHAIDLGRLNSHGQGDAGKGSHDGSVLHVCSESGL